MTDKILHTYKRLIELCIYDENDKYLLLNEIENIVNKPIEDGILFELEEFSVKQSIPFFLGVDSGQGFWDNSVIQEFTYEILEKQFPSYSITLPNPSNYEDTKWINLVLLKDNDSTLRKHNLQFSYFEDENYDYLTIIHQTKDKEEIHNLMKSINHRIFEYDIQID